MAGKPTFSSTVSVGSSGSTTTLSQQGEHLLLDWASFAIPGGRTPAQVDENVSAADLAALPAPLMQALAEVYQRRIAPQVHALW